MEHGSLAYGADWCHSLVEELPELPAMCDLLSNDNDKEATESTSIGTLLDRDDPDSKRLVDKNLSPSGRKMHSRSSLPVNKDDQLVASCSFYDHQLRIWALTAAA